MKRIAPAKLTVRRETLRSLATSELARAAGGDTGAASCTGMLLVVADTGAAACTAMALPKPAG